MERNFSEILKLCYEFGVFSPKKSVYGLSMCDGVDTSGWAFMYVILSVSLIWDLWLHACAQNAIKLNTKYWLDCILMHGIHRLQVVLFLWYDMKLRYWVHMEHLGLQQNGKLILNKSYIR